jgi:hypothetical protein
MTDFKANQVALATLQPSQTDKAQAAISKKYDFLQESVIGKPGKTIALKTISNHKIIDPKTPLHTLDVVIIKRSSGQLEYAIVSSLNFSMASKDQILSVTFTLKDGRSQKTLTLGNLSKNVFLLSKEQKAEYNNFMKE